MITLMKKNKWFFIHGACFLAFIFQLCSVAYDQICPSQTVTHMEEKRLDEIEFPVLFKICVKPAFNIEEIQNVVYKNIWGYFNGQSRHNASQYGWAGHTIDGQTIGSVLGN